MSDLFKKCKIIEEILFPKTSKYFMHQWVLWMTLLNQTFDVETNRVTYTHTKFYASIFCWYVGLLKLRIFLSWIFKKYKRPFFFFHIRVCVKIVNYHFCSVHGAVTLKYIVNETEMVVSMLIFDSCAIVVYYVFQELSYILSFASLKFNFLDILIQLIL